MSGKLTIGGAAPPESVVVNFVSATTGQGGGAVVSGDGTYALDQPLRVGEYVVYLERIPEDDGGMVTAQQVQLKAVPKEYGSPQTSPLKKTINEGDNAIDLDVPKS